jgi:hypothetical protein
MTELPFTTMPFTMKLEKSDWLMDQSTPLFVERSTPLPYVPAKIFGPLTVSDRTDPIRHPRLDTDQFDPPSVEMKTPLLSTPA